MVQFFFEDTKRFATKKYRISEILSEVVLKEGKQLGQINYILCSDEYLLKINQEYLKHDYYTDVISFDYSEDDVITGDIYISVDRIKENAMKFNVTFDNEFCRVLLHGILHFIGFDDKSEQEERIMREKENEYLILFNK